jgi:hypothetical protein
MNTIHTEYNGFKSVATKCFVPTELAHPKKYNGLKSVATKCFVPTELAHPKKHFQTPKKSRRLDISYRAGLQSS